MTVKIDYPLEQILFVKRKRVEACEVIVREKREALEREQKKLKECEEARDKVKKHHDDKLEQMRKELDKVTTSPKIQQMKAYIKVVKEKLKTEEKKVEAQKQQVEIAEKNLEIARQDLLLKRHEVDKLLTHRDSWVKEYKKELEVIETREQDEMGSVIFSKNQRNK